MGFSKQSILIVEDELETLEIMKEIFEMIFSKVYLAEDGKKALELFKSHIVDLILCDINLPKMDGLSVIKNIRDDNLDIPIVIISAYSDTDTLFKASNSNIQGYIKKPMTSNDIDEMLDKVRDYQKRKDYDKKELIKIKSNIFFDIRNSQIIVDDNKEILTQKEFDLMSLLVNYINQIVNYKIIEQIVWLNKDQSMSSTSLRTLVKKLRKKVKYNIIENIPKQGYRLNTKEEIGY